MVVFPVLKKIINKKIKMIGCVILLVFSRTGHLIIAVFFTTSNPLHVNKIGLCLTQRQ